VAVLPLLVISAYLVVTEVVPALNAVLR